MNNRRSFLRMVGVALVTPFVPLLDAAELPITYPARTMPSIPFGLTRAMEPGEMFLVQTAVRTSPGTAQILASVSYRGKAIGFMVSQSSAWKWIDSYITRRPGWCRCGSVILKTDDRGLKTFSFHITDLEPLRETQARMSVAGN